MTNLLSLRDVGIRAAQADFNEHIATCPDVKTPRDEDDFTVCRHESGYLDAMHRASTVSLGEEGW